MSIGIPGGYYGILAQIESGGDPNAVNHTTGASGLYQFLPSTLKGTGYSDPNDPAAIQAFTQGNASVLNSHGIPITDQSLYVAHFLGAGTAANVFGAPDNAPIANYVSNAAIRANPTILGGGQTVGGFKKLINSKVGKAAQAVGNAIVNPLGEGRDLLTSALGNSAGNAIADKLQAAGAALAGLPDPFGGITDGLGITGSCDWFCQFQNWIKNSGFFQRLALAILALIILAAALFSLKDVRDTVVEGAKAAVA